MAPIRLTYLIVFCVFTELQVGGAAAVCSPKPGLVSPLKNTLSLIWKKPADPVVKAVRRRRTNRAKLEFDNNGWSVFQGCCKSPRKTHRLTSFASVLCVCVPTKSFCTYNCNKPWFAALLGQEWDLLKWRQNSVQPCQKPRQGDLD